MSYPTASDRAETDCNCESTVLKAETFQHSCLPQIHLPQPKLDPVISFSPILKLIHCARSLAGFPPLFLCLRDQTQQQASFYRNFCSAYFSMTLKVEEKSFFKTSRQ